MCEPYFSTIQWDVQAESESHIRAAMETPIPVESPIESNIVLVEKKLIVPERGLKIEGFLNYAVAGAGHSEAMMKMRGTEFHKRIMADKNDYETSWWDRGTKFDIYRGEQSMKQASLSSADTYAHRKVVGDLRLFRQWFERAILNTRNKNSYTEMFGDKMLSTAGKQILMEKLKHIVGGRKGTSYLNLSVLEKEQLIKLLLGLTRKRTNLNTSWSDDDTIWI